MAETVTVDSTPSPTTQVLVSQALRDIMKVLGAMGVGVGLTLPDSAWMLLAGVIVEVVSIGWGFYQKFQQARLDHAGSVASARGGKAVQVVPASGVVPS